VSDVSETAALPLLNGAARAGLRIDLGGVDAVVNGLARSILSGGARLRRLQTGVVTHYALAMIAGVIAATAIFAVVWR
jgi:multicomponent Na+:H+ antiporter subunit D